MSLTLDYRRLTEREAGALCEAVEDGKAPPQHLWRKRTLTAEHSTALLRSPDVPNRRVRFAIVPSAPGTHMLRTRLIPRDEEENVVAASSAAMELRVAYRCVEIEQRATRLWGDLLGGARVGDRANQPGAGSYLLGLVGVTHRSDYLERSFVLGYGLSLRSAQSPPSWEDQRAVPAGLEAPEFSRNGVHRHDWRRNALLGGPAVGLARRLCPLMSACRFPWLRRTEIFVRGSLLADIGFIDVEDVPEAWMNFRDETANAETIVDPDLTFLAQCGIRFPFTTQSHLHVVMGYGLMGADDLLGGNPGKISYNADHAVLFGIGVSE